jgi:hypothetical protein
VVSHIRQVLVAGLLVDKTLELTRCGGLPSLALLPALAARPTVPILLAMAVLLGRSEKDTPTHILHRSPPAPISVLAEPLPEVLPATRY